MHVVYNMVSHAMELTNSFKLINRSRLTVVSHEAKEGQSDCQKQNAQRTTVCLLHERTFSSFDIITQSISLELRQLLKPHCRHKTINQHPKDKSNWLIIPSMVQIDEFRF